MTAFDSQKVPCICERQWNEPPMRHELRGQSDDGKVKFIRCARCERTWERHEPRLSLRA